VAGSLDLSAIALFAVTLALLTCSTIKKRRGEAAEAAAE
jgi:hypothetical protein